jgi:large subunit ribosomal protein L7e
VQPAPPLSPARRSPLSSLSPEQEADTVRLRRAAKAKGGFYMEPEAALIFVVRIRGLMDVAPKTKKILQLLRLRRINNGVFLRVNKATLNMLQKVEPYVAYGYPNLKTVRELVLKRGFGKAAGGARVPLTDNAVVEAALGEHGLICVEDLVHELFTVGPAFKQANNFLWPFALSAPRGGLAEKRRHFVEGGQAGNREHFINNLVRAMN